MAPDCIHQLALCPDCGGLQATRLDRLPGVVSITIDGDPSVAYSGPAEVFIGPVPEPCTPKES